ncbi:hypothetical protein O181_116259 [Austropuccinia psidii MF-1]|uniref:Uncharacterized protein n=1 Tax=Austropuccinia psidii MF-1 TaxID=1389203 RepID=A0A9Q3PWC8_9BASI|nr:hypothetical protein [Austropuccinia psidii MF-1]
MESWPLPEENTWSMDTDISWIEEKEVWANYINQQEIDENPDWFFKVKPEPCPDIFTIILPYIEFEDIFEQKNHYQKLSFVIHGKNYLDSTSQSMNSWIY